MTAVGEPAGEGDLGDVVEGVDEGLFLDPEVHLPHARVVDDHRAAREQDELATRRRVPPRAVDADLARREPCVVSDECVDERRLAHAGRPEECARRARRELGANGVEAAFERAETGRTGMSPPRPAIVAATEAGSGSRSVFVRSTTGRAPLSTASAT